uniref:Nucleoporin NSP1-like C-terminal domain-containing protein n=1 Tax=Otolemur garnettii TaxID=30611 RepID=H0XM25_OTOGA
MSRFNFGVTSTPTGGLTFGSAETTSATLTAEFTFSVFSIGSFRTPSQPVGSISSFSIGLFSFSNPVLAIKVYRIQLWNSSYINSCSSKSGFSLDDYKGNCLLKINIKFRAWTDVITGPFRMGISTITNVVTVSAPSTTGTAQFAFGKYSSSCSCVPHLRGVPYSFTLCPLSGSTPRKGPFTISGTNRCGPPTNPPSIDPTPSFPAYDSFFQRSLALASTLANTTSPSTMLFTSLSNASTSTAPTGFSIGAPTTSARTLGGITFRFGLNFPGAGAAASTASTTTSTTTTTTVTTTTTTTTTITSGFILNLKPTSTGISNSAPFTSTVDSPVFVHSAIVTPVMTYGHLEGLINNWNLEMEDHERRFLHQATQVNAWGRALIENGEKITVLHAEMEKVKLDQKRLEQELDFILLQQKELEAMLTPLEDSMKDQNGLAYPQHEDEREKTYKLAENIDIQLKRMGQDLKELIDRLNAFGNPVDPNDPLQQICKIMNMHMDSMQWIDQNS